MSGTSTKPRALRPGARVAVLSPASTPKPDRVHRGMEQLRAMGYRPVLSPHALDRGPLYYAGAAAERAGDLHAAFADETIDGIVCTRGGWGSAELLPLLDAGLIRTHPKPFVGYSDLTSVQSWLRRETGLPCFHGPMVAADFAREGGCDQASWMQALGGSDLWSLGAAHGLRVLQPGVAEGVLEGGCLSILTAALGTPFALQPGEGLLFLEDIGTKPYQWDRMLVHLRHAGMLAGVRGIVFGDMRQCVAPSDEPLLDAAILHALSGFAGPVAIGLQSGHVDAPNVTLPLGVRVGLDCEDAMNPRLHFREAATTL